jgi:hypothetical protein
MLRVDGFSRFTRGLVLIGFALLFGMLGLLLRNDALRDNFPLLVSAPPDFRRGTTVPEIAISATMFMFTIAWGYLLTGALHSHPALRLLILGLYEFNHGDFLGKWWAASTEPFVAVSGWASLVLLAGVFVARWRAPVRPALELPIIMGLVAWNQYLTHTRLIEAFRDGTGATFLSAVNSTVLNLTLFVMPFLLLTGLDIADFAQRTGTWVGQIARQRLVHWSLPLLLVAAIYVNAQDVLGDIQRQLAASGAASTAAVLAFGALIPLWSLAAWWIAWRVAPARDQISGTPDLVFEGVARWALPLVLLSGFVQLLTFPATSVALLLIALGVIPPEQAAGTYDALARALLDDNLLTGWQLAMRSLALILGVVLIRGHQAALGLYLLVFAAVSFWGTLTSEGRPLAWLAPLEGIEPPDAAWLALVTVVTALLAIRRQLTLDRCASLLTLAIILILIRQSEFIGNRFSPFFSFAGVGFVAFGIFWDAMTIGSWANVDSPALPRIGRVFLYIGYVLLTVTVINWALSLHDLGAIERLTGSVAMDGFRFIGKPFLYTIFAVALGPLLLLRQISAPQR